MIERWRDARTEVDRQYLVEYGLLPALATILAMAVGFAVVAAVLMVRDGLIRGTVWTRLLALLVMFVVPVFAVGLWVGRRNGLAIGPPIAAGLSPVIVFVLALGAFGGPVTTPVETPVYTVAAVAVWSTVCACGMAAGATVLGPDPGVGQQS